MLCVAIWDIFPLWTLDLNDKSGDTVMKYGKMIALLAGCAAVLTLSACAYDPYYHPLAAHPYGYREDVVVVGHGPGPHPYYHYNHGYRGWGDHDWDDRY
jgi:hypothetical protein